MNLKAEQTKSGSGVYPLKWSDVAGHPVVVCPRCKGKSESGSENYKSLESRGICANCYRKQEVTKP